jgi:NAD(P)-dependent dehydrogenase (short-subunit alcohol dehydrogenase family)
MGKSHSASCDPGAATMLFSSRATVHVLFGGGFGSRRNALRSLGEGRVDVAVADISCAEEVAGAFQPLPGDARADCLVNCAAIFDHHPAGRMSLDSWERVLKVNLTGAFLCSQAAFPRVGEGSVIVNIGSIDCRLAIPTHVNHAVAVGAHGIRVVSITPSIVDTPMNRKAEEQSGIDPRQLPGRR